MTNDQMHHTKEEREEERVINVLDTIRPYVNMDGGDFEYVGYKDRIVTIKLAGACVGCPASLQTLKLGIEQRLREEIPQVKAVQAVNADIPPSMK